MIRSLFLSWFLAIAITIPGTAGVSLSLLSAPSMIQDTVPFDPEFTNDLLFVASLTGEDVAPPVTTAAFGLATIYFGADKNTAVVNITVNGLSSPIISVNIHEGDLEVNGPVRFALTHHGNRVQQEITFTDPFDLISLINAGTYVSVATEDYPNGEIRGQIYAEQDISFIARLAGSQVVPGVTTDAQGLAVFHYKPGRSRVDINIQLANVTSPISSVQLHAGGLGQNGDPILSLEELRSGNVVRGYADLTIPALINMLTEQMYINVATEEYPEGEIRGQVVYFPGITFDGWMNGYQENPVVETGATGLAIATLYPSFSDINLLMLVDGVSSTITAAHLHQAKIGFNGDIVHNLTPDLQGNSMIHFGFIDNALLSALLEGSIYINAHTENHGSGELRGQLFRNARDGYAFDLCPEQEVGDINAPLATGSGFLSIGRDYAGDPSDPNVNFAVVTSGLTSDVTASHIHLAPIGVNGDIITDLSAFLQNGSLAAVGATAPTELLQVIRSGNTYINVHTNLHPSGEIRGQIVKDNLCQLETSVVSLSDIVTGIRLSPVPVTDLLNIDIETLTAKKLTFSIADITGKIVVSERHELWQGTNVVSMSVSNLVPGFYSLIVSDGQRAAGYKFVK